MENIQKLKANYLSGSGNIFTVFDNRSTNETKEFYSKNATDLTSQNRTVTNNFAKTEGIIVLNQATNFDFEVWFFNPDGSGGMMCGNGGRCAIYFAIQNGFIENYKDGNIVYFEMNNRIYSGKKNDDLYSIFFPPALIFPQEIEINIENNFNEKEAIRGNFVNVGTEHFVIEKENIKDINVEELGRIIRNDACFLPNGTNVNFFEKTNEVDTIFLRTYEKGVENETGACGTGAISTALVYFKKYGYSGKLKIFPTSNSLLLVDLVLKNIASNVPQYDLYNEIEKIILTGFVDLIY